MEPVAERGDRDVMARDGADLRGTIPGSPAASGPPAERAAPAVPGYEILGELGRGGMGVVYQGTAGPAQSPRRPEDDPGRRHAAPEAIARFLAEAEAVARLQHPHIVQIHDIGEADGLPFFELEYVPGGSLDRQLDGTPWPPQRAARLVEQLAGAMAEAHRLGVVHRDLKPANVLLAADGTPKITDFGLAKMLDSESGLTRTDLVLGTPSYMAPEQAGGQATAGRAGGRHLRPGGDPLRAADRPAAVPRRHGAGDAASRSRGASRCRRRGWCRSCRGTWRRSA